MARLTQSDRPPAGKRPTIGMLTGSLVDLFEDQWLGADEAARAITDHGSDVTVIMAPTMDAIMSFKVDTRNRSRRRTSR